MSLQFPKLTQMVKIVKTFKKIDPSSVKNVRDCLFDLYNCKDEYGFFKRILPLIVQSLSVNESNELLKSITSISESHPIKKDSDSSPNNNESSNINSFSLLSNDVIGNIGSYFEHKDGINFSFVDRDCFLSTRHYGFLSNRYYQHILQLTPTTAVRMVDHQSFPSFSSIPTEIQLRNSPYPTIIQKMLEISQTQWFQNLFSNVSKFIIERSFLLPFIPTAIHSYSCFI